MAESLGQCEALGQPAVVELCLWQQEDTNGVRECPRRDIQNGERCDLTKTLNIFGRLVQLGACRQEFDPAAQRAAVLKIETEARLDAAEEAQNKVIRLCPEPGQ